MSTTQELKTKITQLRKEVLETRTKFNYYSSVLREMELKAALISLRSVPSHAQLKGKCTIYDYENAMARFNYEYERLLSAVASNSRLRANLQEGPEAN